MDIQLKYRIAMSKFRLSNHSLNIELGRYNNVLKKIVFVTYKCQQLNNTNVIDCEYHAFLNVLNMILLDNVFILLVYTWYRRSGFLCSFIFSKPRHYKNVSLYIYQLMNVINES